MMRFNNEDERLANASFLFFFFFSLELVRPRGVVVVQFVQFRFKYLRIFFIRMPAVGSVLTTKMKKHKERSFFPPFWWRKEALFVLFEPKKVVSGSLFGCFARERERESRDKKHSSSNLSKKERKKELLIERTKRNATTTRKRRKRKRKRRTKRFLRFL